MWGGVLPSRIGRQLRAQARHFARNLAPRVRLLLALLFELLYLLLFCPESCAQLQQAICLRQILTFYPPPPLLSSRPY